RWPRHGRLPTRSSVVRIADGPAAIQRGDSPRNRATSYVQSAGPAAIAQFPRGCRPGTGDVKMPGKGPGAALRLGCGAAGRLASFLGGRAGRRPQHPPAGALAARTIAEPARRPVAALGHGFARSGPADLPGPPGHVFLVVRGLSETSRLLGTANRFAGGAGA